MGLSQLKILIIDDEPKIRRLVRRVVEDLFGEPVIYEAINGVQAAEALLAATPDLVIVDLRLPFIGGAELCSLMRKHQSTQKSKILAISGFPQPDTEAELKKCGADAFMPKPFNIDELKNQIERLMGNA